MKKWFFLLMTGLGWGSMTAQLQLVESFGLNPGNLNMYLYAPADLPAGAPVVVALHGCSQTADQFAETTGWNDLADTYGFWVIYPEQKSSNNLTRCFNWFETGDIDRGTGEARSVEAMVDYLLDNYDIDPERLFVSGFSAGGAMTTVLLAAYPDLFSGGAVFSGMPYRAALGAVPALTAMSVGVNRAPEQWGDLVRSQNPDYSGPWPRVAVFQGTADLTVSPFNFPEIIEQWTNVHSTDAFADRTEEGFGGAPAVTRQGFENSNGTEVVAAFVISGMGHAVAVDPGGGPGQGGATGLFAADVDFYACYRAAEFWGLTGGPSAVKPDLPAGQVRVFPNPVSERLRIITDGQGAIVRKAILFDAAGREVDQVQLTGPLSSLDMECHPAGLYWLVISSEAGIVVRKVIKD